MKRFFCTTVLALTFCVPATLAQEANPAKPQKEKAQAAEKTAKTKAKEGTNCDPNRANTRCSKPKRRKPWFFGKA